MTIKCVAGMILWAGLLSQADATALPTAAVADRTRADDYAAAAGIRIVRFLASLDGTIADRGSDPHYRPSGTLTVVEGDALVSGTAGYSTVVESNVDQKGGFIDRGVITFSSGTIRYEGIYPTRNRETPVSQLRQTPMVQTITGGTGAFAGATGHIVFISTLVEHAPGLTAFNGGVAGIVFVKTATANHE